MRALILSAGLGERLRPLTEKRAKPSIEFLNVPMIGFPYHWLDTMDLKDLVVNTHYQPASVRAAAAKIVKPYTQLHFTEEPAILGSGGGIWNARSVLEGESDFAIANGDGVVTFSQNDTLVKMLEFHRAKNSLATLLVCPLEGVGTRIPGVWMDAYGEVAKFGKTPHHAYLSCFHYASFMLLSERIWAHLPAGPSNILYEVLEPLIKGGEKVYGYRVDDMAWYETGNSTDYLKATRSCLEILKSGHAAADGLRGLLDSLAPPYSKQSRLTELRLIADGARLESGVSFKGFQVIGEGCSVGAGAILEDCVLLPGSRVEAGALVKDQIILPAS